MAEIVVEKLVCESCGVGVREGAVFCYNCGASVSVEKVTEAQTSVQTGSTNGRGVGEPPVIQLDEYVPTPEPIRGEKTAVLERPGEGRTKLRSAASMRGKVKAYNRQPVEVVWVPRERSSAAFIVVSIVLILFASVLLALALYLK